MPPEVIRRAKIMAAQRDTSVSALVAQLLKSMPDDDDEAIWAREKAAMEAGVLRFDGVPLSREEAHAR